MADPLYYLVTVNTAFTVAQTDFVPGKTYWVSPDIYNSTLDDGSTFASHCITANEAYTSP
jgi:hypothetical protein